jgi:hypothetical protein
VARAPLAAHTTSQDGHRRSAGENTKETNMYGHDSGEPRFDRAQRHIEDLLQEAEVERTGRRRDACRAGCAK